MNFRHLMIIPSAILVMVAIAAPIKKNTIDEVAWIVGDEPIYRSDIEEQYTQLRQEGSLPAGDPYCLIPEQIAVQKLYLHQAKLDSIEAPESALIRSADDKLNQYIAGLGSKEKVEEYFHKPLTSLREQIIEYQRTGYIIDQVQQKLVKDVTSTPNEVRNYFSKLPVDSVPYIPMKVEAQIITVHPNIPAEEIEDVKSRLRDMADRVNRGEASFATLAIMYSEDGAAARGGELGFAGRSAYVPEFSNVAFNLNDPKKVSRIVETEYGYHIIQLIEKRGDQANFRHIILTPKVTQKDLDASKLHLDSLRKEIMAGKFTFEEAARFVSQDKNTKNNNGVMVNGDGSALFEMSQLPPEVATRIESMKPGDVSDAFVMKDASTNKDVVALVKLKARHDGHRATLSEDFNMVKNMYIGHRRQQIIKDWVEKKIKDTYVKINTGWDACEFQYEGWIK